MNINNFIIRTLSAILLIALLAISYIISKENGLLTLCILLASLSCLEYSFLCFEDTEFKYIFHIFSTFALILFGFNYVDFSILTLIIPIFTLLAFWKYRDKENKKLLKTIAYACIGLIVVLAPAMVGLALLKFNTFLLIWLFAVIFSGDTGAYLIGSLTGRHPLLPKISPNKTIEGSIGGITSSVTAGALAYFLMYDSLQSFLSLESALVLALVLGLLAQTGDLFVSLFKRQFNKKDSGFILPGHGGLLDRFDGLFFAAPTMLFYVKYII